MLISHFRKLIIFAAALVLSACSSVIPSNYLGSGSVATPIRTEGQWKHQQIIIISPKILSTPGGQKLLAAALKPEPYRIGPFDNLNIIVWGHPELSTIATTSLPTSAATGSSFSISATGSNSPVVVQTNGSIFYPYVGNIKVGGLTIPQVQRKISARLSRYLRDPQVTVQVAKYRNRNVYVLGEVVMPGMQPLTDKPLTMMEALSAAGGLNLNSSDPSHIYLIRGSFENPQIFWLDATTPQSLMIAQQFPLRENDILYVTAATFSGFNRAINQILPTINSYIIAKGLINQ